MYLEHEKPENTRNEHDCAAMCDELERFDKNKFVPGFTWAVRARVRCVARKRRIHLIRFP